MAPAPGLETPPLTAACPTGQETVKPVTASEGRLWEAKTVGADTTWSVCARAAAATSTTPAATSAMTHLPICRSPSPRP